MASTLRKQSSSSQTEAEPVQVRRDINAPAAMVYQALTEPGIMSRWFGDLRTPLGEGESARLEFGDGDFFDLENIHLDPPFHLRYDWRFLGTGPLDSVEWRITPAPNGCKVKVTDSEAERSENDAAMLRKGWLDFTKRLKDYFATGKPTRYDWRKDFEGSIELPGTLTEVWGKLFYYRAQSEWLRLSRPVLEEGARLVNNDGGMPSSLRMKNVIWSPPSSVAFELEHDDWLHTTKCKLELWPRERDVVLSVSHSNWKAISRQGEYQKQQRKRFCELWIASLKRARALFS
jgi:uncharacterized protein YndB with AHSA1/START domain